MRPLREGELEEVAARREPLAERLHDLIHAAKQSAADNNNNKGAKKVG